MILVYALLASVGIGYACRGRLSHYLNAPLRGLFFPIVSFGMEAFIPLFERWLAWPVASWLWLCVSVQYALSFAFVWVNRARKPVLWMGVATALNALVIACNGFRMPVTPVVYQYEALLPFVERIASGELLEYVLVDWGAPLWWLGDTIPVLLGAPGLASAGDLLMAVSTGWLIVELMLQKKLDKPADRAL